MQARLRSPEHSRARQVVRLCRVVGIALSGDGPPNDHPASEPRGALRHSRPGRHPTKGSAGAATSGEAAAIMQGSVVLEQRRQT